MIESRLHYRWFQYMWYMVAKPHVKFFCAPRSYLFNATHCIRDPQYWDQKIYTKFCTPNVLGVTQKELSTIVMGWVEYCNYQTNILKPYSDCCYNDNYISHPASVSIFKYITNLTALYDSEPLRWFRVFIYLFISLNDIKI
jgi:hypothetical protein